MLKKVEMNIACFSHVGWDAAWQRPQHLLSRVARHHPVLYFNEPKFGRPDIPVQLLRVVEKDNLTAYQPFFPHKPEFIDDLKIPHATLVRDQLESRRWLGSAQPLVGWFYTPEAVHLLDQLPLSLVVYDMMDNLANLTGAPEVQLEQESLMLKRADIIFVSSSSSYESKKRQYTDVHLFPSGNGSKDFSSTRDVASTCPQRSAGKEELLDHYSWDVIAVRMLALVEERLARKLVARR